jgi:hypothetical protein
MVAIFVDIFHDDSHRGGKQDNALPLRQGLPQLNVPNKNGSADDADPFLLFGLAIVALQLDDVLGLQAFLATHDGELNALAFFQAAVTVADDGIEVDEDIIALRPLNETIAFAGVEPLDDALFFL